MDNQSKEQMHAYRVILLALDELIKSGGEPRYDGDKSGSDPEAFKKLVMEYAGDRVSESAIDAALEIPLQDIAGKLLDVSNKK